MKIASDVVFHFSFAFQKNSVQSSCNSNSLMQNRQLQLNKENNFKGMLDVFSLAFSSLSYFTLTRDPC